MELCANECKQRASHNIVPFGFISQLLIYTPALNCSVQSFPLLSVPDTTLKNKTVQPEAFFFFFQRHQSRLAQSLCLEMESLPMLLLNSPGIFPRTGPSDIIPVIQVQLLQLLQIKTTAKISVTLAAP